MEIEINLAREDEQVRVVVQANGDDDGEHRAKESDVASVQANVAKLMEGFESGHAPLADPVGLAELGRQLRDVFLPTLTSSASLSENEGRLLFTSDVPELLNLPWELLPGAKGFLVADARWAIRRRTGDASAELPLVPRPLRVLFTACAPIDLPELDYEREEEAILRLSDRLGGRVHLDLAEAGSFDELADLISEHRPHVVHLSGHGVMKDGVGHFAFEDERGRVDLRDAEEMAGRLFAGRGVRLVFVSGCQSAQAGVAGLCQSLTATGEVPLALGWGASVGDEKATDFARELFHELAAGLPVDRAVGVARRKLLEAGRVRLSGAEWLDATFALPQLYAAGAADELVDEKRAPEPPPRAGVKYELLGDNIRGLREGFVGRRRILQRALPALRSGEKTVVLLTGIGGAGKSTLATRLANRAKLAGYRVVAVQARREEADQFCLRLTGELATACQRLGRAADEELLRDGKRQLADRLRLAVEILNETRILLVLDNLEDLMPPPPAAPAWSDPDFGAFVRVLGANLTGEGRALLTCRYLPAGVDPGALNLAHEALPDFTEADFFKYLRRRDQVAARLEQGELPRDLLRDFARKLGATPRFIEQASAVLARIDPDELRERLEQVAEPGAAADDELARLQQDYFRDLFLPQLYEALPGPGRLALSRLALVEPPLPVDGVARVTGLDEEQTTAVIDQGLGLGLLQRFGEADELPLFGVYPLQREFLGDGRRLPAESARAAHAAAAAFFQDCYENDREEELRLPIGVELSACLHHARAGEDPERRRWATVRISRRLIQRAEYATALALAEPLLADDRHSDLLEVVGRIHLRTGSWKIARDLYEERLPACQAIGDRAGEAATFAQLGTIELNEGNYGAARERFEAALEMLQAIGDRAGEASTLHQLATIEVREGNYGAARERFGEALKIKQAIGDRGGEASTLHQLGTIELSEGNYGAARERFGEALEMRQAMGDRAGEAATLANLGTIEMSEGNYGAARERFGEALAMLQAIGDRAGEAATLHGLATIQVHEGNYGAARDRFGESLKIKQAIGDRAGEAATLHGLASIELNEGNYGAARERFGEALEIKQAIGDRAGEGITFVQIGMVAAETKRLELAAQLTAIGHALLDAIGAAEKEQAGANLCGMCRDLGLDQSGFDTLRQDAISTYDKDQGVGLVRAVFEGI